VRFLEIPLDFRGLTAIYIDVPALRPGTVGSYVFAVLCTLAAFALRLAVDPHVIGAEYITFFPAVTAATLVSGVRAGLVSTGLSFAAVLFLLPPRLSFYVENPAQYPVLALFVLIMIAEVIVAAGMRLALERYHELSEHLEGRVEARTAEALLHSRQCDAANQRLQQTNDELMAVYDQGLLAAHLDMDGRVMRATRASVEGCGFVPSEIIGKPFWECGWWNKPETQGWVRNGFERAASGAPFRGETPYVFKNGAEHTAEIAFIPIRHGDRVAFVFVPALDITERIRQYRATFENAAVGIAHLTPDLKWRQVNKIVTRITGYSAAELAMMTMLEITHPDDVEASLAQIEQVREGKAVYDIEKRYIRKDGTTIWVRKGVSALRNSDGSIDYFVVVFGDITDSKQAQELLRRQADLLNQSHEVIFTWRIGAGITYWNRGAEELYGYSSDEAIGRISHELLQTRSRMPMHEVEAQIAREGSWHGELTHTTRDGSIIVVESRIVRVSYNGDTFALETNRDITERRRGEEREHLLMREMNHRAKNMLTVVDAIAHQTATRDPEDFIERFSERIQALSANQELLVRNDWKGVEIENLVHAQLAHFADLIGSRIVMQGPMLRVKPVGAQALGLALHELATNAGKYGALSTEAGRVDIRWGTEGDTFTMSWTERGGPPVSSPQRRGFGSVVMKEMAERSADGRVELDYAPSGVTWSFTCQAANALEGRKPGNAAERQRDRVST
jgi:PAS domain S-box-containing protein